VGFPVSSAVKNPPSNTGNTGLISRSRSPGEGNGYPLHILAWKISWTEKPGRLTVRGVSSQKKERRMEESVGRFTVPGLKMKCIIFTCISLVRTQP